MRKRVRNEEKMELLICGLGIILTIITTIIVLIVGSNKGKNKTTTVNSKTLDTSEAGESRTQEEILLIGIDKKENEVLDAPEKAEEVEKEKNTENKSSKTGYYIKINNTANVVTIYSVGEDGNMSPIKAMTCSTGTATPSSGVYSVKGKRTWGYLFGDVWGHYTTGIVGNILFHSVPYLSNSPDTLEYWEYDKLGTSASMGCVRLTVADAKWIFDNMPYGTPVEFYEDSNPGPLGKPATMKISGNAQCRDWDPTDPDSDNPWRNNKEEIRNIEVTSSSNNTNNGTENKPVDNKQNETVQNETQQMQNTQDNNQSQNETSKKEKNENNIENNNNNETKTESRNTGSSGNESETNNNANTEEEKLPENEENTEKTDNNQNDENVTKRE